MEQEGVREQGILGGELREWEEWEGRAPGWAPGVF